MSHISIDLDQSAFQVREWLDDSIAYLEAKGAAINHGNGLIKSVSAHVLANLILTNLDRRDAANLERFESMRKEARDTMARFWNYFKLFPITLKDGTQVVAQIAEQQAQPHAAIRHAGADKLNGNGSAVKHGLKGVSHKRMTPDEKRRLSAQLMRGPYNGNELKQIAKDWGFGFSTVSKLYYSLLKP